ncbi:MAG: hypothetical protein HS116_20150 [Planctomycetes bacterium]|nr:hypothetical protein [Planctomycetota bacterium]
MRDLQISPKGLLVAMLLVAMVLTGSYIAWVKHKRSSLELTKSSTKALSDQELIALVEGPNIEFGGTYKDAVEALQKLPHKEAVRYCELKMNSLSSAAKVNLRTESFSFFIQELINAGRIDIVRALNEVADPNKKLTIWQEVGYAAFGHENWKALLHEFAQEDQAIKDCPLMLTTLASLPEHRRAILSMAKDPDFSSTTRYFAVLGLAQSGDKMIIDELNILKEDRSAFWMPGMGPRETSFGEEVEMLLNRYSNPKTGASVPAQAGGAGSPSGRP